jgi:hypothetical protein
MDPLAARAELGDLRARSRLRTPGHAEMSASLAVVPEDVGHGTAEFRV